jgi:hypothetical protein
MGEHSNQIPGQRLAVVATFLSFLAVLTYAPAQLLPLIADDYVQIDLGRRYGPVSSWDELAQDALYRCRAVSILLSHWTESLFGFSPAAFKATSLLLHVLNVLLVFALGFWKPLGWRLSAIAAAFFAIAEGHQEAVIWYAALPEMLVFAFVVAAFLAWVSWLQSDGSRPVLYAFAFGLFCLALLSKESAVCLVGLQAVAVMVHGWRKPRSWLAIAPFAALGIVYFTAAYSARDAHLHFNDGTFSLSAPFWITVPHSIARILWIWGVVAAALLWITRRFDRRVIAVAAGWMVVSLLPYSFLTYMTRVPSRHTYLASVALAWLVAAALLAARERFPHRTAITAGVAIALLVHNLGYLWTRKQAQLAERAQPTERLIQVARESTRPIEVLCFPYAGDVAVLAVAIAAGGAPGRVRWAVQPGCTGTRFRLADEVPITPVSSGP